MIALSLLAIYYACMPLKVSWFSTVNPTVDFLMKKFKMAIIGEVTRVCHIITSIKWRSCPLEQTKSLEVGHDLIERLIDSNHLINPSSKNQNPTPGPLISSLNWGTLDKTYRK